FFSSRRRHTRSDRDWSSDVCSSDLVVEGPRGKFKANSKPSRCVLCSIFARMIVIAHSGAQPGGRISLVVQIASALGIFRNETTRSEERRVGKECRARWWPDRRRKKK